MIIPMTIPTLKMHKLRLYLSSWQVGGGFGGWWCQGIATPIQGQQMGGNSIEWWDLFNFFGGLILRHCMTKKL